MEQTRGGNVKDVPERLKENDLSRALFGALKEQMVGPRTNEVSESNSMVREDPQPYGKDLHALKLAADEVLAEAACEMEQIIRKHAVVRWRENIDVRNRMRDDLDDFLFDLQKRKGIALSFTPMDAIMENVIRIATHRYMGRQYRRKLAKGEPEGVALRGASLHVTTQTGA